MSVHFLATSGLDLFSIISAPSAPFEIYYLKLRWMVLPLTEVYVAMSSFADVIHFVQRRCLPPFRPHVRLQSGLDGRMLDLMRRCWHEFPAERPNFHELRKPLKAVMKDR